MTVMDNGVRDFAVRGPAGNLIRIQDALSRPEEVDGNG